MADNTILNPGASGDTVRDLDRLGAGVKTQVVQLDVGGASSNAEALLQGKTYQPADTDIGMLVRQIGEDNAYTQNILNGIEQLLRSVFQMTSSVGVPALNVQAYQAVGTLLTTATNITNWGSIGVHGVAGTVAPSLVSTNNDVVVAQSQAYHLPLVPQHIYSQIGV